MASRRRSNPRQDYTRGGANFSRVSRYMSFCTKPLKRKLQRGRDWRAAVNDTASTTTLLWSWEAHCFEAKGLAQRPANALEGRFDHVMGIFARDTHMHGSSERLG